MAAARRELDPEGGLDPAEILVAGAEEELQPLLGKVQFWHRVEPDPTSLARRVRGGHLA
jgi:hypothetical protein